MTLKAKVLAGEMERQTDAEALARLESLLTDEAIVAALRTGRAGDVHDGRNSVTIGITETELRVMGEQMGNTASRMRARIMAELPAQGVVVQHYADRRLTLTLVGDPTPAELR